MSRFYNQIKDATVEKQVEYVYKKDINTYFKGSTIEYPYSCDGYINTKVTYDKTSKILRLIMEFKLDEKLSAKINRYKVLIQVLYYIKRFELNGEPLPNVILAGDKRETFVIHTNDIIDYLNEDIDWNIAPSEAPQRNLDLLAKMVNENKVNPYIFKIDENFSFNDVAQKIKELAFCIKRYVNITEKNIYSIYDYFISKVIKNQSKYEAHDLVYIFISLIMDPNENFKHPEKPNKLHLSNGNEIDINGDVYDSFFGHFQRRHKLSEREKFSSIQDRLIEDTTRRSKGEFYTPTIWVNKSHDIISDVLGKNWKEEYIVWDCAWGTGNLTRDYDFKELYCSTINKQDLKVGFKYNINSEKFQYDFLNDDVEILQGQLEFYIKMPRNLIDAFESNKKILFFINPPYATAGNQDSTSKRGIAKTKVNKLMKEDKIGRCSENLYAQFMYRILKIKQHFKNDISIAIFAKPNYMTSETYKKFRKEFLNEFKYNYGMLFNAGYFSDTSNTWGVSFSIWTSGITDNKYEFNHDILDINDEGVIEKIGTKKIYNVDNRVQTNVWVREKLKNKETIDVPHLSSGIKVKDNGKYKIVSNYLGYLFAKSNSIYTNSRYVTLFSTMFSDGHGVSITEDNFMDCMSLFAARRLIKGNWINDKDEYIKPNLEHEEYSEWNNDALIYSLFNTASNQSSLRHIDYKNSIWNIKNEFFFMSKEEMSLLADEYDNEEVYEDIKYFSNERYVYKLLKNIELSKEAKDVLEKAIELNKESFKYRKIFNYEKPEYNINTWDAGWYQIKALLKIYMKKELEEFKGLYSILEEKMKPKVYDIGFLN